MRILVFGNINAGKSTVVEVLRDLHPDLPVISIDDYRKRFGDGSFDGDHKAMSVFTADASATKSCIVECTGLGPLGRQLQKALEPKSSIILHVRASPATCIERIIQKDFSSTPYPPFSEALPDTITRCHSEFEAGDLETLWKSSAFWIFSVDGESKATERMVADLPFVQLSALSVVCSALTEMNQSNALIWYGSGPRGELGPESDIDLFLWTDQASVDIEFFLQSHVQEIAFTDILENKLIIRFYSGVLVEVTCSDDLSALDHFYSYSRINDRSSSILIGNESVLNHINRIAVAETNSLEDVRYLLAEAFYYYCSLGPLARKGDRYKFYFHANILLHNIVRLKALDAGRKEANYLPVDAMGFLDSGDNKRLFFNVDQNMTEFIADVKEYLRRFLKTSALCSSSSDRYLDYLESQ